jgi:hypothetical protein
MRSLSNLGIALGMKRYKYKNGTMRRIGISQRFNDKKELQKYDEWTKRGSRYCIVRIKLLPESKLESPSSSAASR